MTRKEALLSVVAKTAKVPSGVQATPLPPLLLIQVPRSSFELRPLVDEHGVLQETARD